jgi:hypothetical protein
MPERIVTRVIRGGQPEPVDRDWLALTPEERIEGVWLLTKVCLAWNTEKDDVEPRLQRLVSCVQHRGG